MLRKSTAAAEEEASSAISSLLIQNALRRWWKLLTPVGILLAVASCGMVLLLFKPVYRATAWLKIDASPPYVVFQESENEKESARFIATQIQLIKSPMILTPVVGNAEVAGLSLVKQQADPVVWLGSELQMERLGDSELFRLSLDSTDPAAATLLLNETTNAYMRFLVNRQDESRTKLIRLLDQEKEKQLEEIRRLKSSLRELTQESTGGSPYDPLDRQANAAHHLLNDLYSRMITTELQEVDLGLKIKTAANPRNHQRTVPIADSEFDLAVQTDPETLQLRSELRETKAKLEQLSVYFKHPENTPAYQPLTFRVKQQTQALNARLAKVRELAERRRAAETQIVSGPEELASLKKQAEQLAVQKQHLQDRLSAEIAHLQKENTDGLQLQFLKADLSLTEDMQNMISTRITHLLVESRSNDRVELYRAGEVDKTPLRAFPFKEIAVAAMAGLFLPFALAIAWEGGVKKVSDAKTLEKQLPNLFLGEVTRFPRLKGWSKQGRNRLDAEFQTYQESMDRIATSLRLSEHLKHIRILAVASAVPREGKTSLATHLAISIARVTRAPTLLLDGDMRAPDVHNLFDLPLEPGLCEILRGTEKLPAAIATGFEEFVDILPAGRLRECPLDLLREDAVTKMFSDTLSAYRYIIIDTPPLLSTSESLVFAKAADAVLLGVMRDVSREALILEAYRRLHFAGAEVIGVVLNGMPVRTYSNKYGLYGRDCG